MTVELSKREWGQQIWQRRCSVSGVWSKWNNMNRGMWMKGTRMTWNCQMKNWCKRKQSVPRTITLSLMLIVMYAFYSPPRNPVQRLFCEYIRVCNTLIRKMWDAVKPHYFCYAKKVKYFLACVVHINTKGYATFQEQIAKKLSQVKWSVTVWQVIKSIQVGKNQVGKG